MRPPAGCAYGHWASGAFSSGRPGSPRAAWRGAGRRQVGPRATGGGRLAAVGFLSVLDAFRLEVMGQRPRGMGEQAAAFVAAYGGAELAAAHERTVARCGRTAGSVSRRWPSPAYRHAIGLERRAAVTRGMAGEQGGGSSLPRASGGLSSGSRSWVSFGYWHADRFEVVGQRPRVA